MEDIYTRENSANVYTEASHEKFFLFAKLKSTVEKILCHPSHSIWYVHGSEEALIGCLESIFRHKNLSSVTDPDGFWNFLSCLRWIKPTLVVDLDLISKISTETRGNYVGISLPPRNRGAAFFRMCLANGNLCECLTELLSGHLQILKYYESTAFVNDAILMADMVLCLRAVEDGSPHILAQISTTNKIPYMFDTPKPIQYNRIHYSSITTFSPVKPSKINSNIITPCTPDPLEHVSSPSQQKLSRKSSYVHKIGQEKRIKKKISRQQSESAVTDVKLFKQLDSLPDIVTCAENSETFKPDKASLQASLPVPNPSEQYSLFDRDEHKDNTDYSPVLQDVRLSHAPKVHHVDRSPGRPRQHRRCTSDMSVSEVKKFQQSTGNEGFSNSSAMFAYLKNQDLATCADLKKENAHFHFSEMLITMMEEKKCVATTPDLITPNTSSKISDSENSVHSMQNDSMSNISDSIGSLTISGPSSYSPTTCFSWDNTTKHSISSLSIDYDLCPEFESSSENLVSESGTFDNLESPLVPTSENRSAETIAIELLRSFTKDSELTDEDPEMEWLVSEDQVPQNLLPMPTSKSIDPDSVASQSGESGVYSAVYSAENLGGSRIRGNEDWAPPRFQIIFNIQKPLSKSKAIANQKYMCAGCGSQIEKAFIKRFRYCEYLGKYFCSCCHDNSISVIPAHILVRFSFKKYKVSNFAHDLLRKIHSEPLFNLSDINPTLFKYKSLLTVLNLRIQTCHLMNYISACRYLSTKSENLTSLEIEPDHSILAVINGKDIAEHVLYGDPHVFSIQDLTEVKSGKMEGLLRDFVKMASIHVGHCQFCQAKGFICEFCKKTNDIIFPYQISTCYQCPSCRACYHKKCFLIGKKCPKCARISERKKLQGADIPVELA